ncbi:HNH/ENDO VII family nuclease [Candidatus Formimonas warabiya]
MGVLQSGSSHQQGYSNLHQNTGQSPSLINRNEFNQWRNDYWEWRSNDFK